VAAIIPYYVTVTLHSYGVVDEMRAEMVGSDEAGSGADFSASCFLIHSLIVTAFGLASPPLLYIPCSCSSKVWFQIP
jgi:hypothetical protein